MSADTTDGRIERIAEDLAQKLHEKPLGQLPAWQAIGLVHDVTKMVMVVEALVGLEAPAAMVAIPVDSEELARLAREAVREELAKEVANRAGSE